MPLPPRPHAVAALGFAIGLALVLGSSGGVAPDASVASATVTALTTVSGDVLIQHRGDQFVPAREGDLLAAGDTVRTGANAIAEITYFEGSSVRLEENTQLVVQALSTEADGGTVISMAQTIGRTWHVVTKLLNGSSRYEVKTPTSTASVRGTIFSVEVAMRPDGVAATVTTSEGAVVHRADVPDASGPAQVTVRAGEQSTKTTAMTAPSPAHAAPLATLRAAPKRPSETAPPVKHPASSTSVRATATTRAATAPQAVPSGQVRDRVKPTVTPRPKSAPRRSR